MKNKTIRIVPTPPPSAPDVMDVPETRLLEVSPTWDETVGEPRLRGGFVVTQKGMLLAKIEVRCGGPLADKAIYLSPEVDWVIVNDERGMQCLVPLQKLS
jgi:hypothetical protein